MDLLPTSGKAEWHITYRCNLACQGCNRASFLRKPHTPDMTIDDAKDFCRQADAIGWKPRIVLIGGEPTLHPDFEEFVRGATQWSGTYVQVFSNAYAEPSRKRLKLVNERHNASITPDTHKLDGSVQFGATPPGWVDDLYVSPADSGKPVREPCWQHSSQICGISVDHEGYAPCAIGGAMDALLGTKVRTKTLADLFDEKKMRQMTEALCAHCGYGVASRAEVEEAARLFDTPMSPTWAKAFEGRA